MPIRMVDDDDSQDLTNEGYTDNTDDGSDSNQDAPANDYTDNTDDNTQDDANTDDEGQGGYIDDHNVPLQPNNNNWNTNGMNNNGGMNTMRGARSGGCLPFVVAIVAAGGIGLMWVCSVMG